MKIGIPGSLLYYDYGVLWKSFFESLGHEVIISQKTNSNILTEGVKLCVDDACLPVKIFHGHVKSLIGKADAIFIPRLISIKRGEYICPKFIGLPEMIRSSIPNLPPLLIVDFNFHKSNRKGYEGLYRVGMELGASRRQVEQAISKGSRDLAEFISRVIKGENPLKLLDDGLRRQNVENDPGNKAPNSMYKGTIGLIGHPYILFDDYVNMNICHKLHKKNYRILYPENFSEELIEIVCARLPKKLFWSYGKKLLGSGMNILENNRADGVIFLSSFGCGIDSFVGELLHRFNQREFMIPYTMITLDEHSGSAGFDTRLEAFIDMIEWRKNNGHNVSTYGENICGSQSSV